MRKFLFLLVAWIFMVGSVAEAKITGPYRGLNPLLKKRLHVLERHFGHVHITPKGGCRRHGNRLAPKSYHRIAAGCKAADIFIKGVSRKSIVSFWRNRKWGGTGYYCGRSFVHVDVGPNRSWVWFCGKKNVKKRYQIKNKKKKKRYFKRKRYVRR